jgi:hypothetical protein
MIAIDKRKEEKVLRDFEKLIFKLANKQYWSKFHQEF